MLPRPANQLDMTDSISNIVSGKNANIIAIKKSPLNDIDTLLEISFVIKGGKGYII